MDYLLISNMYPEIGNDKSYFGNFVKSTEDALASKNIISVEKAVINRKHSNIINKTFEYIRFYFFTFWKLIFSKYDFVYVHFPTHISPILYAYTVFFKAKIVLNFHGTDVMNKHIVSQFLRFFLGRVIRKSSLVVVPSEYLKTELLKSFKFNTEVLIYPSGGVDLELFYPDLTINRNHIVVGFVGNLIKEKGILDLLDVFKDLCNDFYDIQLYIIGKGPLKNELHSFVKDNNLSDNVRFFGSVPHKELRDLYIQMSFLVNPSLLDESLGLNLIESMSCGTPVVARDVGAFKEIIKPNENGFLFSSKSDLRRIIIELREDKKLLKRLSQNSIQIRSNFNKDKILVKLTEKLNVLNESI